ncbi:MAG: 4Fe-4S ferredoxin [Nitrososphaerota archaeon]|nr:4Fe-4S ferredoxin [Nitrososphaerota archaeon]MDG6923901.1 4Fe-4S ferredoxin [Nitrososphaerota archaeon]
MAYVTAILLKWFVRAREKRTPIDLPLILFILIMMLAMVVSAVAYLLAPGTGLLLDLIVLNMFIMTGGILPIFLYMSLKLSPEDLNQSEVIGADSPQQVAQTRTMRERYGVAFLPLAVSVVLLSEFFMGWALLLASGGVSASIAKGNAVELFSSVVNSYWFIFTMSAEMALTTFFLRKEVGRTFVCIVGMQALIMFLSPTALSSSEWVSIAVYGGSFAMIVLFIYMFEFMARNSVIEQSFSNYLLRLLAIYSLMMAGLFVWELYGSGILFSISIILEMLLYFYLVLGDKPKSGSKKKSWLLDAKWTLAVVTLMFVAEYFMGGLLDAQVVGGQNFLGSLSIVPITGGALGVVGAVLYDFLVWFGTVTGSSWFLIMMGIEMGALVVFKIKAARELETKIRLVMVILAYAIYAILLPSFLIPDSALASVPFVGWSMGVGTAGPMAPTLLVAIATTYLISGILSFLFGARQVCSMFCTAALMYQGTFYDKMKTFNRSSKQAKKFLTTRLSNLYKTIFSLAWASIFVAATISYLDSIGALNLSIYGSDPIQFLYIFYFDFLWYIAFATIPFVGTYACVSMGWCHWGTFNQLVSRLGFFKLKVKSTDTCAKCPTKDCAMACPVGLTNLPGEFISKGEMKSHKCIGVGDCVSSCPYENIQFHDIRHWLSGKIGKQDHRLHSLEELRKSTE